MSAELVTVPKVLFSNANLVETANVVAPPHRPILSPRAVGKFAMQAGYDGVDWHPFFPLFPGSPEQFAKAVQTGDIAEFTLHQSFNNEPLNKNPGLRNKFLASAVGQKLMLPTVADSVSFMADIQKQTGRNVPVVYFPHREINDDIAMHAQGQASVNLFQPKAKELEWWGVDSAADMQIEMLERGYYSCFDTHHGQVGGKFGLLLAGAAPLTRAIHLSVARYDTPSSEVDIVGDFMAARSGNYTGKIGEVFNTVDAQSGPPEFVVVEAPISGVMHATGYTALHDIQRVYQELAEGVQARYAA